MSTQRDGDIRYQSGFGNGFETEALAGTLPVGRSSPQRAGRARSVSLLESPGMALLFDRVIRRGVRVTS
jgi:homogentisate 1,2-dioxygenase